MNGQSNDYRYVCSETYRDQNYDYSTPSYDDTYQDSTYSDQTGSTYDTGSYDDQYDSGDVCNDIDNDGYCDAF